MDPTAIQTEPPSLNPHPLLLRNSISTRQMELHFQQPQRQTPPLSTPKTTKFKGRAGTNNKFVGVRQRPSGRWVAEIKDTTKKIRMWLGTFETAEEAARAYDEAACLLRGSNTRTNFITSTVSSSDSPIASRVRNLLNLKKHGSCKPSHRRPSTPNVPENASPGTCTGASTVASDDEKKKEEEYSLTDEEVYRPCFVNEDHDQLGFSNSGSDGYSWAFESGLEIPFFDGLELNTSDCFQETTITSELDVMKVERQISASLYAMNGVQEYLDAINDSSDSLWDLPPLYHSLCRS